MKKWLVIVLSLVMVLSLTACGGEEERTLETYLTKEEPQSMEILEESLDGLPMTVEVKGNTIYYTYTYDEVFDSESMEFMVDYFESAKDSLEGTYNNLIDKMEEESGIKPISMEVRYEDGEGAEIYTYKF